MLRRKKSFSKKTRAECKAFNDTDYGSNYYAIFKTNDLKLDRQTLAIDVLDIDSIGESSSETNYRDRNNKFFQDNSLINRINRHG